MITRSTNNFGPYQFPEKLIPLFVTNLLEGRRCPLYGDGLNVRDWIYVAGQLPGPRHGAAPGRHRRGLQRGRRQRGHQPPHHHVRLELLGAGEDMVTYVTDRLGHDRRYSVTTDKVRALGWAPERGFREALAETVAWYRDHPAWWRQLKMQAGF